jgi:hypothetical protein
VLDFVANLVKSLGIISECIPSPLSFTVTMSSSLLSFTSTLTVIVPSLVNSSEANTNLPLLLTDLYRVLLNIASVMTQFLNVGI